MKGVTARQKRVSFVQFRAKILAIVAREKAIKALKEEQPQFPEMADGSAYGGLAKGHKEG